MLNVVGLYTLLFGGFLGNRVLRGVVCQLVILLQVVK